jgi:fatty-acyl-CoA synthase
MLSYARGPRVQLLEKTIGQVLEEAAQRNPDGDAIVSRHQQLRLSYRDLEREVESAARGLWGLGIRPGERVGMWAANCAEWIVLQVATTRIGAVLVNVNPANRSHELGFVLRKSGMKAIFVHERDARADYREILQNARRDQDLSLAHAIFLGTEDWSRMLEAGVDPAPHTAGVDDVVNIQYTSGTTGNPKGVLLTHRNLINNAYLISRTLCYSERDRLCCPVPLYHCFGCVMSTLVCIVSGMALVLPSPQFDALAALEAVQAEQCTALYGVPTMFIAELEHPRFREFDLSSLRTGIMAGAPCPVDVMRRVVTDMHCSEMTIAYGQTESSPVVTMSSPTDDIETRVSTVGRAMPETEIKIVVPDSGTVLDTGQRGELCARGYMVMKGYDGEPEATARTIDSEGWLHTGDLAVMRADGCFHIAGRIKEVIIRGGENIYPRELEEFLHGHPKIADVYITGLPDERLGETVLAWIKLKADETATEDEIREFCRGRIAHFKIPQHIRFVESFPMTVSGKVQKFRIREAEIQARDLSHAASIQTA